HGSPLGCVRLGNGLTDAAPPARDEGHLPRKLSRHRVASLLSRRTVSNQFTTEAQRETRGLVFPCAARNLIHCLPLCLRSELIQVMVCPRARRSPPCRSATRSWSRRCSPQHSPPRRRPAGWNRATWMYG